MAAARGGGGRRGAPSVAVQLLRSAESLLPVGHPDADLVAAELADALLNAGMVAEASGLAEAVLDRPHREDVDLPLRLTRVSALSLQNRPRELIAWAVSVLASPGLGPVHQALVLTQASYGRTFSGDFVGGEAAARQAFELAEGAGDRAMIVWSLCARSVPVKAQGRYAEGVALARRAVERAFTPVDAEARLRHPHFFLAMALADSDRLEEARRTYVRAIEESTELGTAWLLPDMLLLSAETHLLAGQWDDAAAEFETGLHLAHKHGQRISIAQSRAYQTVIALARGDLVGARNRLSDVGAELRSEAPVYGAHMVGWAAALVAEAEDEPEEAFDVLLHFWSHDAEREIRYYHRYLGPSLVRLGLALGRAEVAREVVATVEGGATLAVEVPSAQSAARRCRGLLDQDPAALIEAVELARRGGRVLDHAAACEDAASVLARAGRTAEAKDLLVEAEGIYEAVAASAWAARAAAALRRIGVRRGAKGPRRRAETGWDSLTASERAVSELVAEGLTNREVGRRLHISPHTVNTHLRHVFQKMSVSTRTELAATLARSRQDHAIE